MIRRRAPVFVALALVAVVVGALVGRGDDRAGGAAALAPPDASLWIRASTGAEVIGVARRFPGLRTFAGQLLGSRVNLARDVRPWIGGELARRLPAATASAFAGDFLAVGADDEVRAAVARADGGASLADSGVFERAVALDDAPLELYAPAAGVRRLLAASPALLGAAAGFADGPYFEALTVGVRPDDGGLRVLARVLRAPGAPPAREFAPALPGRVPADAAAYVDLPGATALVEMLERGGAEDVVADVRAALPRLAGVDLDRDLLDPLAAEAGLTLSALGTTPVITLTARTSDSALTREALARVQTPLAEQLAPGSLGFGAAPGGGEAYTLPVTAQLQPSYAVTGSVVIASTAERGLAQRTVARRGVAQEPALQTVMDEPGERVEALAFADLRQLLALADGTGLALGAGLPDVGDDLRKVRTVGAVVRREGSDSTAELFLEIP